MAAQRKRVWLAGAAIVLIGIQFIPAAERTNPPFHEAQTFPAVMRPPGEVQSIFVRACYDCHSNETKWPWYASVAPLSWPVRQHVVEGRQKLNFSEWLKPGETAFSDWHGLEEICVRVNDLSMPLPSYVRFHPDAELRPEDRKAICAWVDEAIVRGALPASK